jgi:hypothetical protein
MTPDEKLCNGIMASLWTTGRLAAERLLYSLRVGPHPHALSLGGALRALYSVASLGPQALSQEPTARSQFDTINFLCA